MMQINQNEPPVKQHNDINLDNFIHTNDIAVRNITADYNEETVLKQKVTETLAKDTLINIQERTDNVEAASLVFDGEFDDTLDETMIQKLESEQANDHN